MDEVMEQQPSAAPTATPNKKERPDPFPNDPIVSEFPLYCNRKLDDRLFIVQFPGHVRDAPPRDVLKTLIKPKNKQMRVETAVCTIAANYDTGRGEDLAKMVNTAEREARAKSKDKEERKREVTFPANVVDKVLYKSTPVMLDTGTQCVGVFDGAEFHITPLSGYLAMTPSLDYVDACLKSKRELAEEEVEIDPELAKKHAITVKIRNEMDRYLRPGEWTYTQLQEREASEEWIDCRWVERNTAECAAIRTKLYGAHVNNEHQFGNLTDAEYVRLLIPEGREMHNVRPSLPSNVVSVRALRELPVMEQCRLLLKDSKMIQCQQLVMLLACGKGTTQEGILKSLPQVAVLVRGNWVVKSEILYPQNTYSAISGVSAEQMCKARDYVLYQFTKQEYVERRKVGQTIRLPAEEVKEIFTGVARLRHNRGWELLLPEDDEFIAKHAEIVERQKRLWEQRWQQLNDYYRDAPRVERKRKKSRSIGGGGGERKDSLSEDVSSDERKPPLPTVRRHRKKNNSVSLTEASSMQTEALCSV